VRICGHAVNVVTLVVRMQGYSGPSVARLNAIERRQDVLDNKLSSVLATVDANTDTLAELKSMFTKFMGGHKPIDTDSPSESKSMVEHRSVAQDQNVESLLMLESGGQAKQLMLGQQDEQAPEHKVKMPPEVPRARCTTNTEAAHRAAQILAPKMVEKASKITSRPTTVKRGKEGVVKEGKQRDDGTKAIEFSDDENEGGWEIDKDPYALLAVPAIKKKPQTMAKQVSPLVVTPAIVL
jgi:hypothetical protein